MTDRPVVMVVERKRAGTTAYSHGLHPETEMIITSLRQMTFLEHAWYRLKQRFTNTPNTAVNADTAAQAGFQERLNVGMELSPSIWHKLVTGDCTRTLCAWSWLNKYSSVLLTPVPPIGVSLAEEGDDIYDAGV